MQSGAELWIGYGTTLHKINPRSGHQRMYALPEPARMEVVLGIKSLLMLNPEELLVGTTKQLLRYNLNSGTSISVLTVSNKQLPNVLSLWGDKTGAPGCIPT